MNAVLIYGLSHPATPADNLAAFLDAWRAGHGGPVIATAGGVALRETVLRAMLIAALADLEDLQLPLRVYNALRQGGIFTVSQLTTRTRKQLLDLRNIGTAGLAALDDALAMRGLRLADDTAPDATPLIADFDSDVPTCRVCGCTEEEGCLGGCWWVPDPWAQGELCSACLPPSPAPSAEQWHRRAVAAARAWLDQRATDTAVPVREAMDEHYPGGWNTFLTDHGVPLGL